MILIKKVLQLTFRCCFVFYPQYVLGIWASADSASGTIKKSHSHIKPSSLQWVRMLNRLLQPWFPILLNCINICVVVFSRKANTLFEKNAAPILHLAGVEVTVVKVSYPLMRSMLLLMIQTRDSVEECSTSDRLWRPGQEADGANGADRHADCSWRGWDRTGGHNRSTAASRSRRWHKVTRYWKEIQWWWCFSDGCLVTAGKSQQHTNWIHSTGLQQFTESES